MWLDWSKTTKQFPVNSHRKFLVDISYWLTDKQSISNHVSLCQGLCFSTGFPITINKLYTQLGLACKPGNDKLCTLYLSSKSDTSPAHVAIVKSQGKNVKIIFV